MANPTEDDPIVKAIADADDYLARKVAHAQQIMAQCGITGTVRTEPRSRPVDDRSEIDRLADKLNGLKGVIMNVKATRAQREWAGTQYRLVQAQLMALGVTEFTSGRITADGIG
jgi:hypothetical protein